MVVTCALKGGMVLVLNVIFSTMHSTTFEMSFSHLLQIGIYWDLALLCYYKLFYFRTLLAICFTPISLHLRHQKIFKCHLIVGFLVM